ASRCGDHKAPVDWEYLARGVDTIAVYMGVGRLGQFREELLRHGKESSTPVALIENGTTSRQRTITGTLDNIEQLASAYRIGNPAMIIIGEVVKVKEQLMKWASAPSEQIG
uniref:uroporphyrinogen-III C-methyltransferase n=1 Tax=Paenibacillus zanthoxyli TaxID=369399 RepID=UPI000471EA8E